MIDTLIIKTISKIHFIIINIFLFIALSLTAVWIVLLNGVTIRQADFAHLQVRQLYIKWDEKLNLSIDELTITGLQNHSSSEFEILKLKSSIRDMSLIAELFESIIIKKFQHEKFHGELFYYNDKEGYLDLDSLEYGRFHADFFSHAEFFDIHITELNDIPHKLSGSGSLSFNLDSLEVDAKLYCNFNNEIRFNLFSHADLNHINYKIEPLESIASIHELIKMINLDKNIEYWVLDAIKMKSLQIDTFQGEIAYDHLENAIKSIEVHARVHSLRYTYDRALAPIASDYTDLEFKEGVLFIRPHNATSYGFDLEKSWLKIDFMRSSELLTLFLNFQGKLDENILGLLHHYKIKLPFVQNSGSVDTNLVLEIDLNTLDTEVHGDFFSKNANFRYLGLDIDIQDAYIKLDNYNVVIPNMLASLSDIASAYVDLSLDTKEHKGHIDFQIQKLKAAEHTIIPSSLPSSVIRYTIDPLQDTIVAPSTQWLIDNRYAMKIEPITIDFDLNRLSLEFPKTLIEADGLFKSYLSGNAFMSKKIYNFNIDLLELKTPVVTLNQSRLPLSLNYSNESLTLTSDTPSKLSIYDYPFHISSFNATYKQKSIMAHFKELEFDSFLKSNIILDYYPLQKSGTLQLSETALKEESLKALFGENREFFLKFQEKSDGFEASLPRFELLFKKSAQEWSLFAASFAKLFAESPLMQQYHLSNGRLKLSQPSGSSNIFFTSTLDYPYKLLLENEHSVDEYHIDGSIGDKGEIAATINDHIHIAYDDELRIEANSTQIGFEALTDFLSNTHFSSLSNNNSQALNMTIEATEGSINIGKNRNIVYDRFDLKMIDDVLNATLRHQDGKADIKYEKENFYVVGERFGESFMNSLFALSKFKNGNLEFSLSGTPKKHNGVFHITQTTLLEYKLLNNILAFVNTIPSLVTLSLPGYSDKGLYVQNSYVNYQFEDDIYHLSDIFMESKELKIVGKGDANVKANTIDLILNLKSDLGSSLAKIPVVGYIILNEDSISTTLKVESPLNDPKVSTLLAQEIIVAPLNILKRTIMLPFHLFSDKEAK